MVSSGQLTSEHLNKPVGIEVGYCFNYERVSIVREKLTLLHPLNHLQLFLLDGLNFLFAVHIAVTVNVSLLT
jgi:hypothetical protein